MTFRYSILFVFLIIFNELYCQILSIKGKVVDAETKEPLPFVNIQINNELKGCVTDIDGKFYYVHDSPIKSITVSYVGYERQIISVHQENILVLLVPKKIELSEVVVYPQENPADKIICKVIDNRKINNPENLESFTYNCYNKLIFTLDEKLKKDSTKKQSEKIDSLEIIMNNFLSKYYLFIMEFASRRKYKKPDYNHEEVIASKVSGLKNPSFALLATQMQPFSFYKDLLTISDKNYLNPISPNSPEKYFFLIEDTIFRNNDTVFIISFRPRKGKNFDGLKGILYINTNRYAIENVIAEPVEEKGITMKIQQKYEFIENKQWFPVQLNTDIVFNNFEINGRKIIGISRSYIKDIVLNPDLDKREFSRIELEISPNANENNYEIWKYFRQDSLTLKDINTYKLIDSIGRAENFDAKINSIQSLMTGKIPWGIFEFDIGQILNYNDYEGFKVGLDVITNDKLSDVFSIGGQVSYGFRDKSFKYSTNLSVKLIENYETFLFLSYSKKLIETGNQKFHKFKTHDFSYIYDNDNLYEYLVNKFDFAEVYNVAISSRFFEYFKLYTGILKETIKPCYEYFYLDERNQLLDKFLFSEVFFCLRFIYKEKFIRSFNFLISQGSKYPVINFQINKCFNRFLESKFDYLKIIANIDKTFNIRLLGQPSFRISLGWINKNVPFSKFFNTPASYRNFTIYVPHTFGSMRMNEFVSSEFISLFFFHNFGKLLFKSNFFAPEIVLINNLIFGRYRYDKNTHVGVEIKAPDKGYYECGVLLNNIIKLGFSSIGLGATYRYGPYSYKNHIDNLGLKMSISAYF